MKGKKGIGHRLRNLLGLAREDESFYEGLEDTLIEGDLGPLVAAEVVEELRERVKSGGMKGESVILNELRDILSSMLKTDTLIPVAGELNLFLILGVNGVGKTTTIAKMAEYFRKNSGLERIVLAAGDTFRAAAIEQLKILGERLNLSVVSQSPGADPGAVIFDTISHARAESADLVLADTAGRMHTKSDLVRELSKIDRIVDRKLEGGNYRKILILDATTGQNALHQAEVFHEAVGVDSVILAKFDSTAKGGIVLPICRTLGLPFSFVGTGEGLGDLEPFDREEYLRNMLDA